MAKKDDNSVQPMYGVSHLDGVTPIPVAFNPTTRRMKMDSITAIAFNPSKVTRRTDNDLPMLCATSSADNKLILPVVVNALTGAVLISK